jgi:hypothetical protein
MLILNISPVHPWIPRLLIPQKSIFSVYRVRNLTIVYRKYGPLLTIAHLGELILEVKLSNWPTR